MVDCWSVRRAICQVAMLATLAGCTPMIWVKPHASDADRLIALANCRSRAYAQIPIAPETVVTGGGYIAPMVTSCSGHGPGTTCVTTGGFYTPPTLMTVDANRGLRRHFIADCMRADGWSLRKADATAAVAAPAGGK